MCIRDRYNLDSEADAQHYGIGIKEIWDIDPAKHEQGLVVHTACLLYTSRCV